MRNLRRSTKWKGLVEKYAVNLHPRSKKTVFPTIRELMSFAAVIGVATDRKGALEGPYDDLDSRNYAVHDAFMDTVYMIALAEAKSPEILADSREEEMLSIFERYCDGGFEVISEWQRETPSDATGEQVLINGLIAMDVLTAVPKTEDLMETVRFE